jgi:cellobiose-specific phosphotransferase system component IIB
MLVMDQDAYDDLPSDAQALIDKYSTVEKSVEYAILHDEAQSFGIAITKGFADMPGDGKVSKPRMPYVLPTDERANWIAASAGVAAEVIDSMDAAGVNGQGIYDRALALIAEYDASL